jgi:hypothetical protein
MSPMVHPVLSQHRTAGVLMAPEIAVYPVIAEKCVSFAVKSFGRIFTYNPLKIPIIA